MNQQRRPNESPPCDLQQALKNVGGSEELLRSLCQLFAEECRKQLGEIQQARSAGNPQGVARAAHTLKGSLALLAASDATDSARRMETMAREGDLSMFEEAWSDLEFELNRLMQALAPAQGDPR